MLAFSQLLVSLTNAHPAWPIRLLRCRALVIASMYNHQFKVVVFCCLVSSCVVVDLAATRLVSVTCEVLLQVSLASSASVIDFSPPKLQNLTLTEAEYTASQQTVRLSNDGDAPVAIRLQAQCDAELRSALMVTQHPSLLDVPNSGSLPAVHTKLNG